MSTAEDVASFAGASTPMAMRPVLSREAEATYWMSRYVERAEHVARLLLVNNESLIDVGDLDSDLVDGHWRSLLEIMHVDELPADAAAPLAKRIASNMTFNREIPNSLLSCITQARENARGIREAISGDMWEQLNILYWAIRADEAAASFAEMPDQLYRQIISGSMLFQGLTDQNLPHGQRWQFSQLGKYLERASVTCRILRAKHEIQARAEGGHDSSLWNLHWVSVLRSCGTIEAYRRSHLQEHDATQVAEFLILEAGLPRSVRYCIQEAHNGIATIRAIVRPRTVDPAERILGRLRARLEYAEPHDLFRPGLSQFLQGIVDAVSEAMVSIHRSFFLH